MRKQRTGTGAIRRQIPLSKPKWEITKITNRQNTMRTNGQPNGQLFLKKWSLSNPNRTKIIMNKHRVKHHRNPDTKNRQQRTTSASTSCALPSHLTTIAREFAAWERESIIGKIEEQLIESQRKREVWQMHFHSSILNQTTCREGTRVPEVPDSTCLRISWECTYMVGPDSLNWQTLELPFEGYQTGSFSHIGW